jgi:hypothetical protein
MDARRRRILTLGGSWFKVIAFERSGNWGWRVMPSLSFGMDGDWPVMV